MQAIAELLSALAALAWPAVAAVLLYQLRGPLRKLVESASARRFTLKVAGNELSMEEASEQQGRLLQDLQLKLAELEQRLGTAPMPSAVPAPVGMAAAGRRSGAAAGPGPEAMTTATTATTAAPVARLPPAAGQRLLWVDDRPRNNAYLVAALRAQGVVVDTALDTDEALARFAADPYDVVVSDMARGDDRVAGIGLARRLKALAPQVPVYIYCGAETAHNRRAEAMAAGVAGITASGTELLSALPMALR